MKPTMLQSTRTLGLKLQSLYSRLLLGAMLLATLGVTWHSAEAATIFVTTTDQRVTGGDGCSLQEAIWSANLHASLSVGSVNLDGTDAFVPTNCVPGTGNDTIVLPTGGTFQMSSTVDDAHNFMGPTATPIIFSTITIEGNGAVLRWVGTGFARAFAVGGATVALPGGGSVSGTGNLTIRNTHVAQFVVHGGNGSDPRSGGNFGGGGGGMGAGGAIYVIGGGLTIENSTFDNNGAIGGNGSTQVAGPGGGGGGLGGAGGVGTNNSGTGGGGGGSRGNGGPGGGTIVTCPSEASLFTCGGGGGGTVTDGGQPLFTDDHGGITCGGSGGLRGNDGGSAPCAGGGGGGGGRPNNIGGPLCIRSGGTGGGGNYGGGGGGGGFFFDFPSCTMGAAGANGGFGGGGGAGGGDQQGGKGGFGGGGGTGGTILSGKNGVGGPFGGDARLRNGGGGAALGGAIFSDTGTVAIRNSTFAANFVTRGQGGSFVEGGMLFAADNGADAGGAVFSRNGSLTVNDSTIALNQATGSGGGIVVYQDRGGTTSFTLDNTIIANNGSNECFSTGNVVVHGVNNLIVSNGSGTQPFGACPNPVSSADPLLGPLQLNPPGNTPTMALQQGSPAIMAADLATSLATDQRGVGRKGTPDIGAYETPPPQADLSLTKAVSPSTAQIGDTLTYTLVVSNAGPNAANSVTVSDGWPSQLTFVGCTASGGGSCAFSAGTVTATYTTLALNETETIAISGTLNPGAPDNSMVGNTATVSAASPPDPNPGNNSASASFTVQNNSDLFVTQSSNKLTQRELLYTVNVLNLGLYPAKQLVLTDATPSGTRFVGISPGAWSCTAPAVGSTGTITCNLSSEAVNETQTMNFVVKVTTPGDVLVSNTATIDAATFDPNLANNTATLVSKVGP